MAKCEGDMGGSTIPSTPPTNNPPTDGKGLFSAGLDNLKKTVTDTTDPEAMKKKLGVASSVMGVAGAGTAVK